METVDFPPVPRCEENFEDWSYNMRREMQEILPGLYLGPYAAATKSKLESLKMEGITHIVCIRHDMEAAYIRPNFQNEFKYLVLNIADSALENIIQYFPKVNSFISTCLQQGGKVLVHGNAGLSRSAAMVIAYVMENYGLSYRDAFTYVQTRRFCISLNHGFINQLQEYEPIYKARLLKNSEDSYPVGSLKRKMRDEEEDEGREVEDVDHEWIVDMN